MSAGYFEKLDANSCHTALEYTQLRGCAEGQVEFPAGEVGSPVIDADHPAASSSQRGYPD